MLLESRPLEPLSHSLQSGDVEPAAVVRTHVDRIEAVDEDLHAFLPEPGRFSRLERALAELKDRIGDERERPPLYGVPVGMKDLLHVDGMETRAGSRVPASVLAGPEGTAVSRLKEAGVIILGKTVTTEFGGPPPGFTRNPHDLQHTPGGSSSGSAAAVAAGLCPLAVGTQTGGSIVCPAAYCGVVGYKPSDGRLPSDGIVPFSPTVDQVGLFTQDVPGMELAAATLVDEWEQSIPPNPAPIKLGIPTGPYVSGVSESTQAAFESGLELLENAGFEVQKIQVFDDFTTVRRRYEALMLGEFALTHTEWFEEYGDRYRAGNVELIERGRCVSAEEVARARSWREDLRDQLQARMDDAGVALLVTPSTPAPAPARIADIGDSRLNVVWTYVGLSVVTVPAGTVDGLPVGVQCIARADADEILLDRASRIAEALDDSV